MTSARFIHVLTFSFQGTVLRAALSAGYFRNTETVKGAPCKEHKESILGTLAFRKAANGLSFFQGKYPFKKLL